MASCLAGSTPDRAVWVRVLDGDIVSMCSWARHCTFTVLFSGDEFPRRLCDSLPPVTGILYYRWLAADLHDNIISQGVGVHRVYVGIRHPFFSTQVYKWVPDIHTL